ncbi:coiled-coil domain-containing protein 86 [Anolis carolinensis]
MEAPGAEGEAGLNEESPQAGKGEEARAASGEGGGPRKRRAAPSGEKRKQTPAIPKGRPKSGRVWKDASKKRFSLMTMDKALRTSWERKMKERQEKKLVKDFARQLEEEKQREREEKKQRRRDNLKRRLENERKAEVVQVIRNPIKLKRAKKKQLRRIEKRDTLTLLQKQQAQRKTVKE